MWLQLSQDDDSDESDDEDVEDGDGEDDNIDDDEDDDDDEAMEEDEEELGDDAVDQNFRLELMKVLQKQNALVGFMFVTLS